MKEAVVAEQFIESNHAMCRSRRYRYSRDFKCMYSLCAVIIQQTRSHEKCLLVWTLCVHRTYPPPPFFKPAGIAGTEEMRITRSPPSTLRFHLVSPFLRIPSFSVLATLFSTLFSGTHPETWKLLPLLLNGFHS